MGKIFLWKRKIQSRLWSLDEAYLKTPNTMYLAVAPPRVTVTAAHRPQKTKTKDYKTTQGRNINVGFGGKRKEELWQCIEGCGACCKLAKGPSFAAPEEIFQNTSDIEVLQFISSSELNLSWNSSSIILWFLRIDWYRYFTLWISAL